MDSISRTDMRFTDAVAWETRLEEEGEIEMVGFKRSRAAMRECVGCGKHYFPYSALQKYCTPKCRAHQKYLARKVKRGTQSRK